MNNALETLISNTLTESNELTVAKVIFRLLVAVVIGALIGNERARHGRAAGMRTHIIVCIGSAITAMTGVFVNQQFGGGDVLRIAAQVISGVGFLGAGMIILKNGNIVTGLTTAAGVWTTATIGIALGYGFYAGAITAAVLFFIVITTFTRLEKDKRNKAQIMYVEISDINRVNEILDKVKAKIPVPNNPVVVPSKSGITGYVGLNIMLNHHFEIIPEEFLQIEGVVFVVEE